MPSPAVTSRRQSRGQRQSAGGAQVLHEVLEAALCLALAAWGPPVLAQDRPAVAQSSPKSPGDTLSTTEPPVSYGVEIALSSGHADRGFIISDRPVVQPVTWVSGSGASFYLWSNLTLAQTTDSARPQILEMELAREAEWGRLSVAPAVRTYFYHDPLSTYSTRSIEGWLYLSYDVGPFSLFTNHSVDLLAYRGAYFGEAGIESEGRVSPRVEIGGSFGAGWASSAFNDLWVGIPKSALNRLSAEGWLLAYASPHYYIGPHFKLNSIVDRDVRAELARPTVLFVGLTMGVEF